MNKNRSQIRIGSTLADRYRIDSLIGKGGMGAVYLAEDLKLNGKRWAIKESLFHSRQPQKFEDEARLLVQLDHPYLPHIVDFYPPDLNGFSYLVMDYIKGQTLQSLFERNRNMTVQQVIKYAVQLCEVFDYLHHFTPKPIIYRDLKPSNVMVDDQDNIRLIDFGIARNYSAERDSDTVQLGTQGFAAPEQYLNQQSDARTDLYTLGALMYYLLSGGRFFSSEAIPMSRIRSDVTETQQEIIHKLLMTDPNLRFQSAADVKQVLEQNYFMFPTDVTSGWMDSATPAIAPKLVVIGGLYAGAGSTFTAIGIARVLNKYGISHALLENPGIDPELFALLDGERNAPRPYHFHCEWIRDGASGKPSNWNSGATEWIPLKPDEADELWSLELTYKLLYSVTQPIVLVDISHAWDKPSVVELCKLADEIVAVVDPSLSKLSELRSLRTLERLMQNQKEGKSVHFIANRDLPFSARKEWIRSLPMKPITTIPLFPYADLLTSQWAGRLMQDQAEHLKVLVDQLTPFLQRIVPLEALKNRHQSTKNERRFWFKKQIHKLNRE